VKFRRDADLVGQLQRGSSNRQVADRAINGAPAEINRCRFQDTVARCDSSFDHSIEIRQKPKELIKLSVVLRSSRNKIRIVGRFEGGPEVNRLIDGSLGVWQDSLGFHPAAKETWPFGFRYGRGSKPVPRTQFAGRLEPALAPLEAFVVPHMIIRSLRLQPGKFAVGETKRLLQHYRHETDMSCRQRMSAIEGHPSVPGACDPLRCVFRAMRPSHT
jgi:hypothetical protein